MKQIRSIVCSRCEEQRRRSKEDPRLCQPCADILKETGRRLCEFGHWAKWENTRSKRCDVCRKRAERAVHAAACARWRAKRGEDPERVRERARKAYMRRALAAVRGER